jgi:hypothetical protein
MEKIRMYVVASGNSGIDNKYSDNVAGRQKCLIPTDGVSVPLD